ncbi:MAG: polyribonucleotide nucleotidyltransferase [Simkaniaceae bacterium]|nr:polyribonucleotide nucleotidyltransferase [Simkaniaceae bacterium]
MSDQSAFPEPRSMTMSVGGKDVTFETGRIARQANGAVIVRSRDTMLLSTACMGLTLPDVDFLPLRVDYTEKFSSAGKTLGGFIKREGRPTEREVLVCRLIDRPLRPMFEEGYYGDTQLITSVLSYDGVHSPEPLAICAASAALVLSDIPLIKPIAGVRVGMIGDRFVINPTVEEQEKSRLDLILAGTEDAVLMIEGYCDFLTEDEVMEAVEEGQSAIRSICRHLADWQATEGKEKDRSALRPTHTELIKKVDGACASSLQKAIRITDKQAREEALSAVKEEVVAQFLPEGEEKGEYDEKDVKNAFKKVSAQHVRHMILQENIRCDGRAPDTVRPIRIDLDFLPRTHGSVVFTRGETQTIAVCTLGGETMGQKYETLKEEGIRRFYLQYGFPPFSVGEVGRSGPPGRREIGHGKLAERALRFIVPDKERFPYTIRLESNITESNGSSSMASVCGGALALMQAGVPIKRPVSGIAMGLILEGDSYVVLSDILGVEDALGDMDFKVTGDDTGITAFQLDIKVEGITPRIMRVALMQAKEGRVRILGEMLEACPEPKEHLSEYAPRIETIRIKPSQIGTVIGPGGKQIREIVEQTGVDLDIDDAGIISLTSTSAEGMERAKEIIADLVAEVELGKIYKGKIVLVKDFGAFIAILNKQGLCHVSELSSTKVTDIHAQYKEGDEIEVKVIDINANGQIRLSHKALSESEGYMGAPVPGRRGGGGGGGGGRGRPPREGRSHENRFGGGGNRRRSEERPPRQHPNHNAKRPRKGVLKPPPIIFNKKRNADPE